MWATSSAASRRIYTIRIDLAIAREERRGTEEISYHRHHATIMMICTRFQSRSPAALCSYYLFRARHSRRRRRRRTDEECSSAPPYLYDSILWARRSSTCGAATTDDSFPRIRCVHATATCRNAFVLAMYRMIYVFLQTILHIIIII